MVKKYKPENRSLHLQRGEKLRGSDKFARSPMKIIASDSSILRKPKWIRTRVPVGAEVQHIKSILRKHQLVTVCEEASCPNLAECFSGGTATFMIMGDICTRRCPFCDVAHGKPNVLDQNEPENLAAVIQKLNLRYVVITSVDRDDLRDGGASHFTHCIEQVRIQQPEITIEILVPDFRGRMDIALEILYSNPPDVFNHNLETVPSLYRKVRPGANYHWSLKLLQRFKENHPEIPTKSGLMLGLGEAHEEVVQVMQDMRERNIDMLTLGQYLQPSRSHLPVQRFLEPVEFDELAQAARDLGFSSVASAPLVRSSYHADQQVKNFTA
jgi:lipoic acid synthetase